MFTVEERINAAPETVWRFLTEPAEMGRWMAGIETLRSADAAALQSGSTLLFRSRGKERASEVVELAPHSLMVLRSSQGPVTATYRYRMVAESSGVRVSLEADCVARGVARLFSPAIRAMIRKVDGGQISALKAVVEQAPAT